MNAIRQIQSLNKRELENAVPPEASWHADYRDTAYINIGGLPFDLSEGDIVTIFSQYGEPVYVNLVRDKETGKSRGFAFLKYEDQRSTDLAVDNLGGATVLGRMLRVDHVRYKRRDDEEEGDNVAKLMGETVAKSAGDGDTDDERRRRRKTREEESRRRPLLKEEKELEELMVNHDEEDPMKGYLIQEKKEEIAQALEKLSREKSSRRRESSKDRSSRHHRQHRHHHRRRDEDRSRSQERSRRARRSRSKEGRPYRDRSPSRRERTYRDRTPVGSRSPEPRRNRDRDDRRR
ncbi:hypothetical protein BDV29DRAFT_123983 [Aspergillus leporis]|uniref:RRM domain-containing protein n=1 Tax=Aspergillus leporis TaxID=41062 RepID=A0A5N5X0Q6_9EURO|nr:hypothetical protein BDV29DRAFT_123983 [Aspergillus leporis]